MDSTHPNHLRDFYAPRGRLSRIARNAYFSWIIVSRRWRLRGRSLAYGKVKVSVPPVLLAPAFPAAAAGATAPVTLLTLSRVVISGVVVECPVRKAGCSARSGGVGSDVEAVQRVQGAGIATHVATSQGVDEEPIHHVASGGIAGHRPGTHLIKHDKPIQHVCAGGVVVNGATTDGRKRIAEGLIAAGGIPHS